MSSNDSSRRTVFWEIIFLTGLFYLVGGWPVPDVNEQYYVGKAIHFWNPNWLSKDVFLNSSDSHWLFYGTFGVFSLVFAPTTLVWFGRIVVWLLTAWSWRRLSFALIPKPWLSILTAAAFLFFLDSFHLAGEWIVGGIEGKSFAFPFVFLGLEAFFRGKDRLCWIFWGTASAFHVLVGGWTVLAALVVWTLQNLRSPRTFLKRFGFVLPGLLIGGAISLFGLIPALLLDSGSAETIRLARQIYVFERLSHHLVASSLPWTFLTRFGLLVCVFVELFVVRLVLNGKKKGGVSLDRSNVETEKNVAETFDSQRSDESISIARFNGFVFASLLFAAIGLGLDFGIQDKSISAKWLRFYWFRLSDWAVPFGVAFSGLSTLFQIAELRTKRSPRIISPPENSDVASAFKDSNLTNAPTSDLNVLTARSLFFVFGSILLFFVIKNRFLTLAREQAVAASEGFRWSFAPKPVDGISFLATIVFVLLFLTVWLLVDSFFNFLKRTRLPQTERITSANPSLKTESFPNVFVGFVTVLIVSTVFAPIYYSIGMLQTRSSVVIPRSEPPKESIAAGWRDVCRWSLEETDPNAVFLVPRGCDSFKWNACRAEAGNWKEIPQDASSIVQWFQRMNAFYAVPGVKGANRWNQPLIVVLLTKGPSRVLKECRKCKIDYIVAETPPYSISTNAKALERYQTFLDFYKVYQNDQFIVFDMNRTPKTSAAPNAKSNRTNERSNEKNESPTNADVENQPIK